MPTKLLILTVFFVAVVFFEIKADDDDDDDDNERKPWETHAFRVKEFECGVPQPRSFLLHELDPSFPKIHSQNYFPPSTVLHRCESAGCCSGGKICSLLTSHPVDLTFGILRGGSIRAVTIEQLNHTSCSCQKDKNGIK